MTGPPPSRALSRALSLSSEPLRGLGAGLGPACGALATTDPFGFAVRPADGPEGPVSGPEAAVPGFGDAGPTCFPASVCPMAGGVGAPCAEAVKRDDATGAADRSVAAAAVGGAAVGGATFAGAAVTGAAVAGAAVAGAAVRGTIVGAGT